MKQLKVVLYIVMGILAAAVMGMTIAWFFTEKDLFIYLGAALAVLFLICFPCLLSVNGKLAKVHPSLASRLRRGNFFVDVYPYGKRYIAAVYPMSEIEPFLAWRKAGGETDEYECIEWEKIYPVDIKLMAGNTVVMPAETYELLHADDKMKDLFRKNKVFSY